MDADFIKKVKAKLKEYANSKKKEMNDRRERLLEELKEESDPDMADRGYEDLVEKNNNSNIIDDSASSSENDDNVDESDKQDDGDKTTVFQNEVYL